MTPTNSQLAVLTSHEWVHAFEQDTAEHEVYVPIDSAVPPARRPRERLRLNNDQSASVGVGGADDRSHANAATWSLDGRDVIVTLDHGSQFSSARTTYRITQIAAARLLVRAP